MLFVGTDHGGVALRPLPPQPERLDLFAVLNCLADPIRLSIVAQLAVTDDLECGTFEVPVTKSTLTHHFRVLREAGVIATTKRGTRSLNRLRRAELEEAFPGLLPAVLTSSRAALSSTIPADA
jgi:DNA-binding transcriptional ArsR family regulator